MSRIAKVTIFGYADTKETDSLFVNARKTARELAQAGYTIVNGGGPGVMRAATLGAKEGQGKVIGVTFYPKDATNFEGRDPNNPIDEEIITNNYVERTIKLMELGDCYIIFQGGTGTLSEFAMAWGLARLYFGHHKPLVLFGRFWQTIMECLSQTMLLRPEEHQVYQVITTPEQAVQAVRNIEMILESHQHLPQTGENSFKL